MWALPCAGAAVTARAPVPRRLIGDLHMRYWYGALECFLSPYLVQAPRAAPTNTSTANYWLVKFDERPDLILLDVDMPQPDGFEVCRRLKAYSQTMHIPVVFLSGITSADQKIRGLELGAVDYITKPFKTQEIVAIVQEQLNVPATTNERV